MMLSTTPVWCHLDRCCQFVPGSHNAVYCPEHHCKRKAENARKRLGESIVTYDEEGWELEERRKLARSIRSQQKNEWILANKKIVFFDLETFDLAADFGLVMVGCVKTLGGGIETFVAHGDADELHALLAIRTALEEADYVVGYYSTRFDLPYLNTRLILNKALPVQQIRHIDLYYTARFKLRLNRNRLASLELALFGGETKTAILPGIWRRALQGSQADLDYVTEHCKIDVDILERCFLRLVGFVNLSATRLRRLGASY